MRKLTAVQQNYHNAECPDCGNPIPRSATDGSECRNCGHVYYTVETSRAQAFEALESEIALLAKNIVGDVSIGEDYELSRKANASTAVLIVAKMQGSRAGKFSVRLFRYAGGPLIPAEAAYGFSSINVSAKEASASLDSAVLHCIDGSNQWVSPSRLAKALTSKLSRLQAEADINNGNFSAGEVRLVLTELSKLSKFPKTVIIETLTQRLQRPEEYVKALLSKSLLDLVKA